MVSNYIVKNLISDKDRDEADFFVKANKRSEFISKLIMIGILISVGGSEVLLSVASIIISLYLFGEIRVNILFRPHQLRFVLCSTFIPNYFLYTVVLIRHFGFF